VNRRRPTLIAILAFAGGLVFAGSGARAGPANEMSLGNPKAPVTVIEYASLGCSHCGVWAREVFPEFKKRFIDTGRVRFVLREMLTGDSAVAAAGFLTARCAPADKYFQVVDGLFDAAPRMEREGDDMPALLDVAARAGLTKAQVSACLGDHAALAALEARAEANASGNHVDGTPEFDVAGRRFKGETSLADLASAIDAAHPAHPRH
jgi:protein-disulfide isomerase